MPHAPGPDTAMASVAGPRVDRGPARERVAEPASRAAASSRSRISPALAFYITLVFAAAALLLAATLHTFPAGHWSDLALFLTFSVLGERWAVAVRFDEAVSISLTVSFAAALLFGPAFASIVAIGGVLISDLLISGKHWTRVVFNCSQLSLSSGLAAAVYARLAQPGPVDLGRDTPAIVAAAIVFLFVNDTLVTVAQNFSWQSFWHEWTASFREAGIPYVSMARSARCSPSPTRRAAGTCSISRC